MIRICLVTTGQPSTNPRLVKEADALAAEGYYVHVVGAHWAAWADRHDTAVMSKRSWTAAILDWRQETHTWLFWKTRVRHRLSKLVEAWPGGGNVASLSAAGRISPELARAASAWPADLYIAHNLGALPAAAAAARLHGAALGFDAEDYHRGQFTDRKERERARRLEERYLPICTYVSAASPGVAEVYTDLCARPPIVVLNVFPRNARPAQPDMRVPGPLRLYWFSQTIGRDRGLEAAVTALGVLRDLPVELHLQGEWQPGFEAELRRIGADAGLAANRLIHHLPGDPDEMVRSASRFDVGLALEPGHTPNSDRALSNKVFTYLLAGLPVVASATSAQAALCMQLGDAARVVAPDDATALAEAIRGWIADPASLEAAKRTAWHLGETRFNWDVEQRRFLDVVRQALRAAAPAVRPGPAVGELA